MVKLSSIQYEGHAIRFHQFNCSHSISRCSDHTVMLLVRYIFAAREEPVHTACVCAA